MVITPKSFAQTDDANSNQNIPLESRRHRHGMQWLSHKDTAVDKLISSGLLLAIESAAQLAGRHFCRCRLYAQSTVWLVHCHGDHAAQYP